ncbi:MAG TPA: GNAT family N-acetyltransferase [Pyrinomonadaceae bacterium]|nr:GNAT family N-acetyltransferase [Pyrinomonadaceae bacterium]
MFLDADIHFINEEFFADRVAPHQLDELLANGWRHFGTQFFRYSLGVYESDIRRVIPLRIRLHNFLPSKSQRRALRQNADASVEIRPIEITGEAVALFEKHKHRFKNGVPESIHDFLEANSSLMPCEAFELNVRVSGRLVAASYFDVGAGSVSAIYGMFDPEFSTRSLGIFTMLKEIEFALANGKEFYYQGYSYEGQSFYDYKKRFRGTEGYDWTGTWEPAK